MVNNPFRAAEVLTINICSELQVFIFYNKSIKFLHCLLCLHSSRELRQRGTESLFPNRLFVKYCSKMSFVYLWRFSGLRGESWPPSARRLWKSFVRTLEGLDACHSLYAVHSLKCFRLCEGMNSCFFFVPQYMPFIPLILWVWIFLLAASPGTRRLILDAAGPH